MKGLQKINEEYIFVQNLQTICQVYEELSVMKMNEMRENVLHNRTYYQELINTYFEVKTSYKNQVLSIMHKKNKKDIKEMTIFEKNGKTAEVLITANTKLHGSLIQDVFNYFVREVKEKDSDIFIVGKLGDVAFQQAFPHKNRFYFEFPDAEIGSGEAIKTLSFHLTQYEKVNLYCGKFENLFNQTAMMNNITGDLSQLNAEELKEIERFLFEPDLDKVLVFFETKILNALIEQNLYEHQLARYGSRIKLMEQILGLVETNMTYLKHQRTKYKNNLENRKQQERFASLRMWT